MSVSRWKSVWEHRATLNTLVKRDMRIRYSRSFLGYLWTLIDPLAMSLVYAFVFGIIWSSGKPGVNTGGVPIVVFLIAGLLPYNWFSNVVNETSRALYAERLLVRSTNLPREIWVLRVVLAKGIEHLLSLPILFAFILYFWWDGSVVFTWKLLAIVPALLLQFVLLVGIGLMMAPVTALVDDFIRLVRIILRMLFYLTPIVYSLEALEANIGPWARLGILNPLAGINELYRVGFIPGATVDWQALGVAALVSVLWVWFGSWVFRKLEPAILKEI